MKNIFQDYEAYSERDQKTWAFLCKRQQKVLNQKVSIEFLDGFRKLNLDGERIVKIADISQKLEAISGWTLVPVAGLIPTKDFFFMLINKKYPITIYIRQPDEIDFSEQPDIFHDVCGHLPLLTNEKFSQFLTAYSVIAIKYANNARAIEYLGRLYWFTYEMGIFNEGGEYKPYGGAIITSANELANLGDETVAKHKFDIDAIFNTSYDPFKLQRQYFFINSFDDLFESLENLETKLITHLLIPEQDNTLRNYSLNPRIGRSFNNVIGFLNEIHLNYPDVISFVAGQPDEKFFELENSLSKFDVYVNHLVNKNGKDRKNAINNLGQYSRSKGIINDLVAEYLRNDENITLHPDHILMTVGAQEAFAIILSTICDRKKDVVLIEDPSYIGLSSFAKVFDFSVDSVQVDEEGIKLEALKKKIIELQRIGNNVKLVYVIPDYQNPTGSCMPIGNRLKLLELARQYNFLIVEDTVYNSFTYAQKKNPTLKSLDKFSRVIYVGSFSKSLFPGLRLGLIGADQILENELGENVFLIDEMMKVKAQLTNSTSTISQTILAGVLLDQNCSLSQLNIAKYEGYRTKRNRIVQCLNKYIRAHQDGWSKDIAWKEPEGGFFIKVSLPFQIDERSVAECAEKFKVIFCPMKYFYLSSGGENEIRLTFSNLSPEDIEIGVRRLAGYLKSRMVEVKHEDILLIENELS